MATPGGEAGLSVGISRVSLWLLRNEHFVQSTQRTRRHTRPFVHGINNLLKLKNIDAPMLTRVWQKLEYHIDVDRVTHSAHIEHL
jgi:hypothetical protein